ncbi:MAG: hypothetical protein WDN01_04865 [Rhizomicrobium sp.]
MRRIGLLLVLVCGLFPSLGEARDGSEKLRAALDHLVAVDSQSWMFNRYDVGSMTNVAVQQRSRDGGTATLYGEYTYNGGAPGWVRVRLEGGELKCMEFWDFSGICRPIGASPSHRIFSTVVTGVLAGAMSGGGGSDDRPAPGQGYCPSGDPDHPFYPC